MKRPLQVINSLLVASLVFCAVSIQGEVVMGPQSQPRYEQKKRKKKVKKAKAYPKGDIKSVKGFERYITSRKRVRVAVLFYTSDGPELEAMARMFDRLDHSDRYHEAGVRFVTVNLDRGDLNQLVTDFQLSNIAIPQVIFFKDGFELARENRMQGFLDESAMRKMIEETWGDEIDRILQEKEEERERRAMQWLYYGYPYWYGYPYYGYPGYYYGYPYGGYGPRFGIGFGVGF